VDPAETPCHLTAKVGNGPDNVDSLLAHHTSRYEDRKPITEIRAQSVSGQKSIQDMERPATVLAACAGKSIDYLKGQPGYGLSSSYGPDQQEGMRYYNEHKRRSGIKVHTQ